MRNKISNAQLEFFELRASGRCEICGTAPEPKRKLSLDHNHVTGNLRGLLCRYCNLGLGAFKDDPLLLLGAIEYLSKRGEGTTPVPKSLPNKVAVRRAEREAWWKDKH